MQSDTWKRDLCIRETLQGPPQLFDTFAWPTGSTPEDFGINDILTLAKHFNKQLSTSNMKDECKQALCNEWYEFKVIGKGKKLNELLDLALADDKGFPTLRKLLSILSVLPVSTVCCERGSRDKQLQIIITTTNVK
jgi:hypothetical protein